MWDVAYSLSGGSTTSSVIDGRPGVRLFTVRGREVAGMSDLYRDDDVFIGVAVGRRELNVTEVRQIFQELYPDSEYSETLIRKWMRTRRRHMRPRQAERATDGSKAEAVTDASRPSDKPTSTAPGDSAEPEAEKVENETSESKPAAGDRPDDVKTSENDECRRTDGESRLSRSLVRPAPGVRQRRRGGSEPRDGQTAQPTVASTTGQQPRHEGDAENTVARSRPRQRGRRQIRLPPLEDSSSNDAEPGRKPRRKVRLAVSSQAASPSPVRTATSRETDDKDLTGNPAPNSSDTGRGGASLRDGEQRLEVDVQPDKKTQTGGVVTDENFNIITEVQTSTANNNTARSGRDTARSVTRDVAETGANMTRSGKEKKRSQSTDVKIKTKFERQVSTVQHVMGCYETGRTLGDGNFAVVKQCRHRESGREFAMKIIDKSKMANKVDMVENEIAIMKQCNHVNIVRLYEEYETKSEIYLIMELVKVCLTAIDVNAAEVTGVRTPQYLTCRGPPMHWTPAITATHYNHD